jgi:hypothetical protein
VNESEMGFVVGVYQVIIVLVNLYGSKLALVDNVFVGKGAKIKPIVKANGMGRTLS